MKRVPSFGSEFFQIPARTLSPAVMLEGKGCFPKVFSEEEKHKLPQARKIGGCTRGRKTMFFLQLYCSSVGFLNRFSVKLKTTVAFFEECFLPNEKKKEKLKIFHVGAKLGDCKV